ncbi:MAG: hypothetical protein ABSA97_14330 [Verrucomicrobiia bacterium]
MKIESLHVGMKVRHPHHGIGVVKSITEHTAEIRFDDATRTIAPENSGMEVAEARATVNGLEIPLRQFIEQTAKVVLAELGIEKSDEVVEQLASRWRGGRMLLHPADTALQAKEVPLDVFFHKIVMVRNNLRVLEQKINSHATLSDADKVELQQYITRSYGSLTTFNILFKNKQDQFKGSE